MKKPISPKLSSSIGGGADRAVNPPGMQSPMGTKNGPSILALLGGKPLGGGAPKPPSPKADAMPISGTMGPLKGKSVGRMPRPTKGV